MSARPLLERMNFDAVLAAHLGPDFLDTLQIEQIQGGPNDGMFVAHDAVAKLTGMQLKNAGPKIKNIASSMEGEFKSLTIIPSGHANVSLVNFCTTNTNLY